MLLFIVGVLFGLSFGFHLGFYFNWMRKKLEDIYNRDPEPSTEFVTPLPPEKANPMHESTAFITPITPYEQEQIEKQRQERIERGL